MPLIAGPHYAASKAGLVGLTAAARDLAPHGITIAICIAPGRILSEMTGPPEAAVNRAALVESHLVASERQTRWLKWWPFLPHSRRGS